MLYMNAERAGCSIQQATAKRCLFGRNFSEYWESSRNNLCLYCNMWLQSCWRAPGDGSREAGAALLLETSLVTPFEFMGTAELFLLRNTSQQLLSLTNFRTRLRREEWGTSWFVSQQGRLFPLVTLSSLSVPFYGGKGDFIIYFCYYQTIE